MNQSVGSINLEETEFFSAVADEVVAANGDAGRDTSPGLVLFNFDPWAAFLMIFRYCTSLVSFDFSKFPVVIFNLSIS